jgi:MFS family permease
MDNPPAAQPTPTSTRRVAVATLIGTSIEWYDFFVYGSAAALVFDKLFFPTANPLTGTLLALATFGVGFVARPIGGVAFAHFGDKIGRKSMLVLSVLLMGGGTVTLGLRRADLLLAVIVSSVVGLVSLPFYGWACDRFGRRRVIALYMAAMVMITIVTAFVSPDPYGDSLRRKEAGT